MPSALQTLRDKMLAILPTTQTSIDDPKHLSFRQTITTFLELSADQKQTTYKTLSKVLLLIGNQESPKTLFCQNLLAELWRNYKEGCPIPLWISLPQLKKPFTRAIEETLENYGFTLDQIAELKKEHSFIFIIDGYEQLKQLQNVYVTNHFNLWRAKTIITCSSEWTSQFKDPFRYFMPFHGEQRQPQLLQIFALTSFEPRSTFAPLPVRQLIENKEPVKINQIVRDEKSLDQKNIDSKQSVTTVLPDDTLFYHLLTKDQEKINFFADRVIEDPVYKNYLFHLIEQSKMGERYAIAAANAITALNRARVSFSARDFRNIRIPNADVSYGIFDNTQLQGADLTGVNFTGTWLRQANLSDSNLSNIELGELPFFQKMSVQAYCYSLDGRWLALTCGTTITIYDANNYQLKQTLTGSEGVTTCMVFNSNGQFLAVGNKHILVKLNIFNIETKLKTNSFFGYNTEIKNIVFSRDSSLLLSITLLGHIEIRHLRSEIILNTYQCSNNCKIAFDNSNILLVADVKEDMNIQLFYPSSNKLLQTLKCHTAKISVIDLSHNFQLIAVGYRNNIVKIWAIETGMVLHTLTGHAKQISALAFSIDDLLLATGSSDTTIRIWNTKSGKLQFLLEGHNYKIQNIVFRPDTRMLISSSIKTSLDDTPKFTGNSTNDNLRIWNISQQNNSRYSLITNKVEIKHVIFSSDGRWLISGDSEGTVQLWSTTTGVLQQIFTKNKIIILNNISLSTDNRSLFVSTQDDIIYQWELFSGKLLHTYTSNLDDISGTNFLGDQLNNNVIAFSKDKKLVIYGSLNDVQLKTTTNAVLRSFKGHMQKITCVALSSDAQYIASGSEDKTLRLWSISGRCLAIAKGFQSAVLSINFVKNQTGLFLATGNRNSTIYYWQVYYKNDDAIDIILRWNNYQSNFNTTDINVKDTRGLNSTQYQLLKQNNTLEEKQNEETVEIKKFSVPCLFGENRISSSFPIYLGELSSEYNPIYFQILWLKNHMGGEFPLNVANSMQNLLGLAQKYEVSFPALTAYSLDMGQTQYSIKNSLQPSLLLRPSTIEFLQCINYQNVLTLFYKQNIHYYENKKNDASAQYRLGVCYEYGYGVLKDEKQANDLFHSAANNGDPRALYHSLMFNLQDTSVENINVCLIAALQGVENANYRLSVMLDVTADYLEIIKRKIWPIYRERLKKGDMFAAAVIGFLFYLFGTNAEKSKLLFKQAGESGIAAGYFQLGLFYERGIGSSPNLLEAIKYYELATKMKHLYATERVADIFYYGCSNKFYVTGVELTKSKININLEKAFFYYKQAAEQGSCKAQAKLAWCYWHGRGVAVDWVKACEYTALHLGGIDDALSVKIDFDLCAILACWYTKVSQQYDLAKDLYGFILNKQLKNGGELDLISLSHLAKLYKNGWGVTVNIQKALQLCDDVINAATKDLDQTAFAHYIRWQILLCDTIYKNLIKAKSSISTAIKTYLYRVQYDRENIAAGSYYRLGQIISQNRLSLKELIALGLNYDANYYYAKATQVNKKNFYSHLYADLARQKLLNTTEKSLPIVLLDAKTSSNLAEIKHVADKSNKQWNLPLPNNHYFLGCKVQLNLLKQQFISKEKTQCFIYYAITGLSGRGKTELARYYIHNTEHPYNLRAWFHANNEEALLKEYYEFALQFDLLDEKSSDSDLIFLVKSYFERSENWLIIYDDVGSREKIEKFLPVKGGHLIITTYRYEWCEVATSLNFDFLDDDGSSEANDAEVFFKKIISYDEKDYNDHKQICFLKELTKRLFYFKPILIQIGAHLNKYKNNIIDYLKLSDAEIYSLLVNDKLILELHNKSVITRWDGILIHIFKSISDKNTKYNFYLAILFFISTIFYIIDYAFLIRLFEYKTTSVTDISLLKDFLDDLKSYSFISFKNKQKKTAFVIHPALQLFFRGFTVHKLLPHLKMQNDAPIITFVQLIYDLGISLGREIELIKKVRRPLILDHNIILMHVKEFIYHYKFILKVFFKSHIQDKKFDLYWELAAILLIELATFYKPLEAKKYYEDALEILLNYCSKNYCLIVKVFCLLADVQYKIDKIENIATLNPIFQYFDNVFGFDYQNIHIIFDQINMLSPGTKIRFPLLSTNDFDHIHKAKTLLVSSTIKELFNLIIICQEKNNTKIFQLLIKCVLNIIKIFYCDNSWQLQGITHLFNNYIKFPKSNDIISFLKSFLKDKIFHVIDKADNGIIFLFLGDFYLSQHNWLEAKYYLKLAEIIFFDLRHPQNKNIQRLLYKIKLANFIESNIITTLNEQDEKLECQRFYDHELDYNDPKIHEDLACQYVEKKNIMGVIYYSKHALRLLQDQKQASDNVRQLASLNHNLGCYYHALKNQLAKFNQATAAHAAELQAEAHFKKGLSLAKYDGLHTEYAKFLLMQQKTTAAIIELNNALKLINDDKELLSNKLSYTCIESDTLDPTLQSELDFWHEFTIKVVIMAHYLLVTAYIKENEIKNAKKIVGDFSQVVTTERSPLVFSLLGHTQQLINDHVSAVESYQEALKLKPDYTVAQQHLKQSAAICITGLTDSLQQLGIFKSPADIKIADEKPVGSNIISLVNRFLFPM